MSKSEELLRLERDLNEQAELKEKLDAEIRRVAEAGEAQSDGEAMAKAAAALGYTITPEELERTTADLEKLDDDELEASGGSGGSYWTRKPKEDEYGHSEGCLVSWHCFTAFLHTESKSTDVACWKDHKCVAVNKDVHLKNV